MFPMPISPTSSTSGLSGTVGHLYPEHFSRKVTPKKTEASRASRHGGDRQKATAYERMMAQAFAEAYRRTQAARSDGRRLCP